MRTKGPKRKSLVESGVALLMVLASLALLSGVVVEFAYNSNVTYNLALNDLDRVQAYYLAKSGIQFSKLLLKYDKEARQIAKKASQKMGKNFQIQPLYEMIPINTAIFRGLAGMSDEEPGAGDSEEEKGDPGEEGAEGGEEPSALEQGMNLIDSKGMQEFLGFKGDFSAEVSEEDSKLNLNAFYGLTPKQKSYDRLKSMLYHLLVTDAFKGMFEDRFRGAKDLSQHIVDFIDKDEVHNEPGGEERGREVVAGSSTVNTKNGKLISIEELILVEGMTDQILQTLKEFVTIYGSDEKIYICRAKEPLVKALLIAYTEDNPKMEPIKDDNQELLTKVTEAVLNNCPDTKGMEKELLLAMGVSSDSSGGSEVTEAKEGPTSQGTTEKKSASQTLADLVKEEGTIFSIIGIGTVGESEVKLRTVVDASQSRPGNWKEIYWRVE